MSARKPLTELEGDELTERSFEHVESVRVPDDLSFVHIGTNEESDYRLYGIDRVSFEGPDIEEVVDDDGVNVVHVGELSNLRLENGSSGWRLLSENAQYWEGST